MINIDEYTPKFSGYRSLMPNRISEILLLSNLYDAFVLEEDGSLSEQIWSQYVGMRLTGPPNVRRVSTVTRALDVVRDGSSDLVIAMMRLNEGDPFAFAREAREINPNLPVVLLLTDPAELATLPPYDARGGIDKIFLWNNDPQILLAIIKLVEDSMNVDYDTTNGQVRVILLMEDSIQHYSSFLPIMYTGIMNLTRSLIDAGFNDLHKQLRMRSRAKILLSDNFEEGMELYRKYKNYTLGVISDVRYWRKGKHDPNAGFDFVRAIKKDAPHMPVMLQSQEPERNRDRAFSIGAAFLDKNSPSLLTDLRNFLEDRMGFGDFVFRMPSGEEVGRAANVYDFVENLQKVPIQSLIWHARHNHISNWLMARTEVTIAEILKPKQVTDYSSYEEVRHSIVADINRALEDKQNDVVAEFSIRNPSKSIKFMHLGEGSMGGKGRGIAFVRYVSRRIDLEKEFPGIDVGVPPTLVIGAGEFDRFLSENKLRKFAIECDDMEQIRERFLDGRISPELYVSLRHYLGRVDKPVAVRSSSILEDSHLQPFAGLYDTFMLPNNSQSEELRLKQLLDAVKMVWASTFGPDPKAYFRATSHRIEQEKMAIVLEEVIGKRHGRYYYPTFSGVGQSYNFYPYGPMEPEDGVAHIALGLGKTVVEGGKVVRFSPKYPQIMPQFSTPRDWLDYSQKQFFAIDMEKGDSPPWEEENEGLTLLELEQAEKDGELDGIASVYSPADEVIRDTLSKSGPRILTFAGILKYKEFRLSAVLQKLFEFFSRVMGCAVEIEFAVNLHKDGRKHELRILQLRPLISRSEHKNVAIVEEEKEAAWCLTETALGNCVIDDLRDIVYVRPDTFDRKEMSEIITAIGIMNRKMKKAGRKYLLIGFGRWGSADRWLGIGVGWAQISEARVMVEAGLPDFRVDPSNGAHFFQNITSLGIGYLTVPYGLKNAHLDWDWLSSQPSEEETRHLRHIRLPKPCTIKIDGRKGTAVILQN